MSEMIADKIWGIPHRATWAFVAPCLIGFPAVSQTLTMAGIGQMAATAAIERAAAPARLAHRRAEAGVMIAEGAFEWTTSGNVGVRTGPEYIASGGFLTTATRDRTSTGGAVYAERLFSNGIRIQPGVIASRTDASTTRLLGQVSTQPVLQVDIPIDRTLGNPIEKLRLEHARAEVGLTDHEVQVAQRAHVHQSIRLAWALLAAQKREELAEDSLEEVRRSHGRASALVQRGELPPAALVQADARRSIRSLERDRLRAVVRRLQSELAFLLQSSSGQALKSIRIADPLPTVGNKAGADELVQYAIEQRPDLKRLREEVEAARIRVRMAEYQAPSRVNLQLRNDAVGISWSAPLGSLRQQGYRDQAAAELELAEHRLAELTRRVEHDVREAVERALAAERLVAQLLPAKLELGKLKDSLSANPGGGANASLLSEIGEQYGQLAGELIDNQHDLAVAIADLTLYSGQANGAFSLRPATSQSLPNRP